MLDVCNESMTEVVIICAGIDDGSECARGKLGGEEQRCSCYLILNCVSKCWIYFY